MCAFTLAEYLPQHGPATHRTQSTFYLTTTQFVLCFSILNNLLITIFFLVRPYYHSFFLNNFKILKLSFIAYATPKSFFFLCETFQFFQN